MSEATAEEPAFDIGRVIDRMTGVARQQAWRIAVILVGLVGLPVVAQMAWNHLASQSGTSWPLTLLNFVLQVVAQAMITLIGLNRSRGRPVTLRGLFSETVGNLPALCAVSVIQLLGIALGFMLLIVPGFYAIAALSMAVPLLLNGQLGVVKALRQSPYLTDGSRWSVLKILLPVSVLWLATTYVVYSLCKLAPDPKLANAFLLEPVGRMVWVLGQGLALAAIFHELVWGPSDATETVTAELFD